MVIGGGVVTTTLSTGPVSLPVHVTQLELFGATAVSEMWEPIIAFGGAGGIGFGAALI